MTQQDQASPDDCQCDDATLREWASHNYGDAEPTWRSMAKFAKAQEYVAEEPKAEQLADLTAKFRASLHKHEYMRSNLGCWLKNRHPSTIAPEPQPAAPYAQPKSGDFTQDNAFHDEPSQDSMTQEEFAALEAELRNEDAERVTGTKGAFSWLFGSDVEEQRSAISAAIERLRLKLRGASREQGYDAKSPSIVQALEIVELFQAP